MSARAQITREGLEAPSLIHEVSAGAEQAGSPIRVLHVIEAMHQGGAESLVVEHARRAGPGIEAIVCALNRGGPALDAVAETGVQAFMLGKGSRRLGGLKRLADLMRALRVDVVNGHNPTGGLYGAIAAKWAGVPLMIRTEHNVHHHGRHSPIYPMLEPLSTALARRVVCVCQAVLESHVSRLPWAARRFVTVANGISPAPHTRSRETVRQELGLSGEDRVALTVGRLHPQKAQHLLLEAFSQAIRREPRARLLIAGEGPLQAALEERGRAADLAGHVRFLGPRNDVADLMEAADLFVLSSLWEGLPVVVLEAMRAGRPVVATPAGGTGEAVEDGVTGRLVPVGEVGPLAEAISEILADPARGAAFGEAGRRRWSDRFTAERMVRDTEAIYRAELGSFRFGAT